MNDDQGQEREGGGARAARGGTRIRPSAAQTAYLRRGLDEPGGKLPLFDRNGQRYPRRTIESCIVQGWAEPWFRNPIKPDWLICKLTEAGEAMLAEICPAAPTPARHQDPLGADCDARRLQVLVKERV